MPFAPKIAFVDVETTGTSPASCRITEVGVVSVSRADDGWTVEEWSSLVNPGVPIPPEIRFLTGISDEMVAQAPAFAALAPELLERLEGAVLVAHQARFDYGFLRAEFERAGQAFGARTLCTVRLSRLMDPQRAPHTLDAIIARYALSVPQRHRALGDARALWLFVQALSRRHSEAALRQAAARLLAHPGLPAHLGADALDGLPHAPGVYAMLGATGQPLYIGRSRDLKRRVASHFSHDPTRERAARLAAETHRIEWHQTVGELGARLLEGQWIRQRQPSHNIAQRRTQPVFVRLAPDDVRPRILPAPTIVPEAMAGLYGPFGSRAGARAVLEKTADAAGLCRATLGLERRAPGEACFRRQLGRCAGACVGLRLASDELAALREAMSEHRIPDWPYHGAIALVETDPLGREAWHVFRHWQHLGTAHGEQQAHDLARPGDEPHPGSPAPPREAPSPIEPEIYRLLRQRLAQHADHPGAGILRTIPHSARHPSV